MPGRRSLYFSLLPGNRRLVRFRLLPQPTNSRVLSIHLRTCLRRAVEPVLARQDPRATRRYSVIASKKRKSGRARLVGSAGGGSAPYPTAGKGGSSPGRIIEAYIAVKALERRYETPHSRRDGAGRPPRKRLSEVRSFTLDDGQLSLRTHAGLQLREPVTTGHDRHPCPGGASGVSLAGPRLSHSIYTGRALRDALAMCPCHPCDLRQGRG